MSKQLWTDVDNYFDERFVGHDEALQAAVAASHAAGLPPIQVSPTQGKFLMLLARCMGARRILEVGTLGGYSSIWLARALPAGGQLLTCELKPAFAEVARANLQRAGLAERAQVKVGRASETLAQLISAHTAAFDLIFIDADKAGYPDYFSAALELSRPGSVIVADNVVRDGEVLDAASRDADLLGIRRFLENVSSEPRVSATALQTVGEKGYDGFALAVVNGVGGASGAR